MNNRRILKVVRDSDFELIKSQKIENYYQFLSYMKIDMKKEELENLRMDATGYSPDLAKRLGREYIKNYLVITTVNQRDDIILRDDASYFRPLINYIYSHQDVFNLINDITLKEVLLGKFSCYYDRRFRRLFIEVDLETPGESIKRLRDIRNEIATLRQDPYRMLSQTRTERLLKMVKEPYDISERFPTLDLIKIPDNKVLPIRRQLTCFRESDDKGDVYYFIGKRNMVIYFSSVKPTVYLGNEVDIFLNGDTNREQVLNVLFRHGYIGFREDLTNNTLERIAWESLSSSVTTSSFFADTGGEMAVTQTQIKSRADEYKRIRNRITKNDNQNNMLFRELDFSIKSDMVEAKKNRREIRELLSKLQPENYVKMYMYDARRFRNKFTSSMDDEKEAILKKILTYTERNNKFNPVVNTWLAENYFKLCKDMGIRFVV